MVLFCGCDSQYPQSALYVGKGRQFETISAALKSADMCGQYIVVEPGTYTENLIIDKSVKLIGHFSRTVVHGSVTIASHGVTFENIVFDGKNVLENGIIINPTQSKMAGINFQLCDIKNYNSYGLFCPQTNEEVVTGIVFDRCDVVGNGICGLYFENAENAKFLECYFENNGKAQNTKAHMGAIDLNYQSGKFCGIEFHGCDFRRNGSASSGEGAALMTRYASSAFYDGEIVVDGCYFLENSQDVITGSKTAGYSPITISNINQQSWTCNIITLRSDE